MKKILPLLLLSISHLTQADNGLDDNFFVAYQVAQSSNLPQIVHKHILSEEMLERIAIETLKEIDETSIIEKYRNDAELKKKINDALLSYLNSSIATNIYDDTATKIYDENYTLEELKAQYQINKSPLGQNFLEKNLKVNQKMQEALVLIKEKYSATSLQEKLQIGTQQILNRLIPPIDENSEISSMQKKIENKQEIKLINPFENQIVDK